MENEETRDSAKNIFLVSKRAFLFGLEKMPFLMLFNLLLNILLASLIYIQFTSFSKIVDEIIFIKSNGGALTKNLYNQSIILGLSFLVPAILQNLYSRFLQKLRMSYGTHMQLHRIDIFAKLDIGTVESTDFQTKLERAEQWGLGCTTNLVTLVLGSIKDIVGLIVSAVMLYLINPWLVLLAVIGGVPIYYVQKKYGYQLYKLYHDRTDDSRIIGNRNSFFRETRKMIEVILFSLFKKFRNDIEDSNIKFDNKIFDVNKRKSNATFWTDFLNVTCLMIAVVLVAQQTLHGTMLVGSLLLAFNLYRSFTSIVNNFYRNMTEIEDQARYAKRWYDLFDIKPKVLNKSDALKPVWEKPPVIEFKNVSFAYPETDKLVTKNISFKLESGEKLALVGVNGAGKTTLIKLLCRIYDPKDGEILVDGVDLKDIDLDYWREYLGVLFQDFSNFNMTAREAIAISRPNEPINEERMLWAAKMAEADEFIQTFPKKYDHLLWKGYKDGVELSKGQHQRMAVARILYRDALISILDEPTSAIDAVAEEKIFEVLETKMTNKTVILISHRFSTVKNADQIAVIEHGELKEIGNHKELMSKDGRYAELYNMQAKRYLEETS